MSCTVARALVSVSDKTGIVDFAHALDELGVEILSTGGTAKQLREAGVPVVDVSSYTGFPEMMDGRVKTLHPRIHGGLLARRDADTEAMREHGIAGIDLLVVNLYPFERTVAKPDCDLATAIENIDIGGPAMLRAAAKNHAWVTVVVDAGDYAAVLGELRTGGAIAPATRFRLAVKAFEHTARYDGAIASYLGARDGTETPPAAFPRTLNLQYVKWQEMRYGENPHQRAALYVERPGVETGAKAGVEPGAETGAEADAKARAETGTEARAEADAKAGVEPGAETGAEADAKARAETGTEARAEADAKAGVEAGTEAGAEVDAKACAETGTEARAETGAKAGVEVGTEKGAEADAKAGVEPGTGAGAKADAEASATAGIGTGAEASVVTARQLQGKALSFNNVADTDAALECVKSFYEPACVIVKHANPCGVAIGAGIRDAYDRAFRTDPTSAFGGIIAFNRPLDGETAAAIVERQFVEVVIAPRIDAAALAPLAGKENVRVLECGDLPVAPRPAFDFKRVTGGLLVQDRDTGAVTEDDLEVVTRRAPTGAEMRDLLFAWKVVKFVKSNAIVYCRDGMTIGIGAGQMSRVYSAKIAGIKAADEGLEVRGSVLASDAFFPFRDGIDAAAEAGVGAVIEPGGSMRDDEVIAAADEHGMAMVFTRMRHFRH